MRNDLFRPDAKIKDANEIVRQQAYWQGYCDALGFMIRLPETVAAAQMTAAGELVMPIQERR